MCIFKENEPGPKSRNENGIDAHGFTNAMRISANAKNNTSPLHGKGYELRPTCNCPFSDICPKNKTQTNLVPREVLRKRCYDLV